MRLILFLEKLHKTTSEKGLRKMNNPDFKDDSGNTWKFFGNDDIVCSCLKTGICNQGKEITEFPFESISENGKLVKVCTKVWRKV